MAHAATSHDPHEEHTGHGAHHVFQRDTLLKTFGALVGLTVITVVLALMERSGALPLGPFSIAVALGIAGVKAFFVASFFMGLWHDRGTNLLIFLGSLVFLAIFFTFTFLDFGFRNTFDEQSAVSADVLAEEAQEAEAASSEIQQQFEAVPLVEEADPALFGETPALEEPTGDPTPAIDAEAEAAAPTN